MGVAIRDLRKVVRAAGRGGRHVVLGGHSLGGTITVAYATWDFGGRAGARDLDGLVLIDGGSSRSSTLTRAGARRQLDDLEGRSPWLDLTGAGLPWSAGVFNIVASTATRIEPDAPSVLGDWPFLPADLRPAGGCDQRGWLRPRVRPRHVAGQPAADPHAHRLAGGERRPARLGRRRARHRPARGGDVLRHPRDRRHRLVPPASASASTAVRSTAACATRAQTVLGVRATHGDDLGVPIYAIETSLGAGRVLKGARRAGAALARRGPGSSTATGRTTTSTRCPQCRPRTRS